MSGFVIFGFDNFTGPFRFRCETIEEALRKYEQRRSNSTTVSITGMNANSMAVLKELI